MLVHGSPGQALGADTTGETLLIAAILRQLLKDARSPHAQIREQITAWLADRDALHFWGEVVGLDAAVLQRYVQQALQRAARHA
jgi:hypothetical protein